MHKEGLGQSMVVVVLSLVLRGGVAGLAGIQSGSTGEG